MPNVIHLIPIDGIGGVEVAGRSMLKRPHPGCDFKLMLVAGNTLHDERSGVLESPYRSPDNPLAHWRALRQILHRCPDVLVCSLWRSIPVALIARMLRPQMRLVLFLHLERSMHWIDAVLSRIAMRCADAIWCDSATTLEKRISTQRQTRARVISYVTERLQAPAAKNAVSPRFVIWARLNAQKGIDRALDFIAALARSGVDARYDIYGPDGGELASLEAQRERLGLSERVCFHGPAPHNSLPEVSDGASFFLQLSRFEGMGMGVVEAMQLGLVPVVTSVGEFRRYVTNGLNGVIVDLDAIDEAIERVSRLLEDQQAYNSMRKAAIETWSRAPLYAEDVCHAAEEVLGDGDPAHRGASGRE